MYRHHIDKLALTIATLLVTITGQSQMTSQQIDQLVNNTLTAFNVPGIAVAIVKDGKVIHSRGYGVRSIATKLPVDENTLFAIASNSKAFTTAAMGILIDEGKLSWDTKVIDIIPEFRLYNAYVTEEFTVRDLLCHRSGLGLGAGDLMFWPDSSDFTLPEVIHNLRYLKQVSGFRTKYDYDNLLYMVAGEVVHRVSGKSWEDFVETRIMQPLGMSRSAGMYAHVRDNNVIDAHAPVEGKITVVPREKPTFGYSAGGIYSCISDLAKWVIVQLENGKYNGNQQLFSEKVHADMWTLQTVIPVSGSTTYNTHFAGYGLGWFLNDVKGYKQVSHTGGLAGMVTQITLLPELKLGIIVLTNQQSGSAFSAITNQIKDSYFGIKGTDRVKEYSKYAEEGAASAKKVVDSVWAQIAKQKLATEEFARYAGLYHDNWFGDISISQVGPKLYFKSLKSHRLEGEMFYYKGNSFVVKWNDRSLDADAFVNFTLDRDGAASNITMQAISPLTDFSFDFQDLSFTRK